MMKERGAFTLVEVLIVVAIAGVMIAAGVTPLMFTVRTLSNTRQAFTEANRERAVFNRIVQDLREASQLNATSPVRVVKSEELAMEPRDALIVWTITPTYAGGWMGNVIYAIPGEAVLSDSPGTKVSGLYRWVTSADIVPETDLQALLGEEPSQLVLPDLVGFSVKMLRNSEWPEDEAEDYVGGIPQALQVTFEYEEDATRIYEAWFPNG